MTPSEAARPQAEESEKGKVGPARMSWEKLLIYICALLISLGFVSFAVGHLLSVAYPLLNQ